jgi:virginiamycin B lyase
MRRREFITGLANTGAWRRLGRCPTVRKRAGAIRVICLACAIALGAMIVWPVGVWAQVFTYFHVPTANAGPSGITVGPDGALWFTESEGNNIGRITIAGAITEYPVPTGDSVPSYITTGPDGALWFTESNGNKIGRMTTAGVVTDEFPVPTPSSSPAGIITGPDNMLWFAEANGSKIARMTTSGVTTEFPVSSGAESIAVGPDGAIWFVEFAGKIGKITTAGVVTEFSLPTSGYSPRGIAAGPDGALWFTESACFALGCAQAKIGRITTGGAITEFDIPGGASAPGQIAMGPDGALWFGQLSGCNQIAGCTEAQIGRSTTGGVITLLSLSPNVPVQGINAGPDAAVWFTDGSAIGQITLSPELLASPASNIVATGFQHGPFASQFQYQLSTPLGSADFTITGVPSWLTVSLPLARRPSHHRR